MKRLVSVYNKREYLSIPVLVQMNLRWVGGPESCSHDVTVVARQLSGHSSNKRRRRGCSLKLVLERLERNPVGFTLVAEPGAPLPGCVPRQRKSKIQGKLNFEAVVTAKPRRFPRPQRNRATWKTVFQTLGHNLEPELSITASSEWRLRLEAQVQLQAQQLRQTPQNLPIAASTMASWPCFRGRKSQYSCQGKPTWKAMPARCNSYLACGQHKRGNRLSPH